MSDLLPLVAATLREKVLIDAQEELDNARRELAQLKAVEVIGRTYRDNEANVVCATGQIDQGKYAPDPHFWEIGFSSRNVWKLSDLVDIQICVGGGFVLEELSYLSGSSDRSSLGVFHPDSNEDTDTSKSVCFYSSDMNDMWLKIVVHGWPRESLSRRFIPPESNDTAGYLINIVAKEFPDATIEFKTILLETTTNDIAIGRLVPSSVLQAAKDNWMTRQEEINKCNAASIDLIEFVAAQVKGLHGFNPFSTQEMQQRELLDILAERGISDHTEDNENELIATIRRFKLERRV